MYVNENIAFCSDLAVHFPLPLSGMKVLSATYIQGSEFQSCQGMASIKCLICFANGCQYVRRTPLSLRVSVYMYLCKTSMYMSFGPFWDWY